jgi:hypothetical protein
MTMTGQPASARETYEQYLKGEVTLEQVEQRARAWYSARAKASESRKDASE